MGSVSLHFQSTVSEQPEQRRSVSVSASVLNLMETFWLQRGPKSTSLLPLFEKLQKVQMKNVYLCLFCCESECCSQTWLWSFCSSSCIYIGHEPALCYSSLYINTCIFLCLLLTFKGFLKDPARLMFV